MDELCALGGFDRWQFRWDNALVEGKATATGQVLRSGVGVRACLEALKDRFQSARYAGIAAGIKNTGIGCGMPDFGRAKIVVTGAGKVVLHHGWCEMGQGAHNMALQTLVTETGIDPALRRGAGGDRRGDLLRHDHRLPGHLPGGQLRAGGLPGAASGTWPPA